MFNFHFAQNNKNSVERGLEFESEFEITYKLYQVFS